MEKKADSRSWAQPACMVNSGPAFRVLRDVLSENLPEFWNDFQGMYAGERVYVVQPSPLPQRDDEIRTRFTNMRCLERKGYTEAVKRLAGEFGLSAKRIEQIVKGIKIT